MGDFEEVLALGPALVIGTIWGMKQADGKPLSLHPSLCLSAILAIICCLLGHVLKGIWIASKPESQTQIL